jgi:hypothetical protein
MKERQTVVQLALTRISLEELDLFTQKVHCTGWPTTPPRRYSLICGNLQGIFRDLQGIWAGLGRGTSRQTK